MKKIIIYRFRLSKYVKALSLKQPYAELVVSGKKTIELRKWNTKFRGTFLIHASKNPDKQAMLKFGFSNLPTGGIVGQATLKEVKKYNSEQDHSKDKDKHLGSSVWGNYGFILENVSRLPFKLYDGKLNFFEI